ncbi:MAG: DUF4445 domain-containing protein [Nitrospirae bacterium]|nr:DUF4445 domain-containing protein [Nitrospirota bacterium]
MKITLPTGKTVESRSGESILSALRREKVYLVSSCGGRGTCGKCKIQITEGTASRQSLMKLDANEIANNFALACKAFPDTDIAIEIPKESRLLIGDKIAVGRADDLARLAEQLGCALSPLVRRVPLVIAPPTIDDNISDLERIKRELGRAGVDAERLHVRYDLLREMSDVLRDNDWQVTLTISTGELPELLAIHSGTEAAAHYGVAVDIGTTTVVVYLIDMLSGKLVDVGSTYNSQMRYGDDVINRIVHATEHGMIEQLQQAVVGDINNLLDPVLERHNLKSDDIDSMVIAGNTTMTQLFYCLNPEYIREEPYIPAANAYPEIHAGQLGIDIHPNAPIFTAPCVASYVGGDISAGVLASGMARREGFSLFMDIGTNGEIALGNREMLVTAACSAGPCFEGSGMKCGMRATEGAIEGIEFDPRSFNPTLKVVGGGEPLGICGSGMIDAIGDMYLKGIIDQKGKLQPVSRRVREGDDGMEILLSGGRREVVLTESDIENIIRAKAAIHAGYSVLLNEIGFTIDMLDNIYIAGGFGNYLNIEKAILLGMLPDVDRSKFVFLGNTSITGAAICLLSGAMRAEVKEIAAKMTYVELSVSASFMDEYMSAMFLPHTDMNRYPTVLAKMGV